MFFEINMEEVQSMPDFFANKEIFITGGSGFLGKALIEKLLRSCPDIKKIYVLIREKKGQTAEQRINQLLNNELFDTIRATKPEALKKLVPVSGDVSELKLGLSQVDYKRLLNVNIVFHAAASVRFDDPLKKAILMNTRGTREMMELLLEMRNLEVAVHVSTTYCNTDKDVIEERVYRDHGDWREAIRIAEEFEDDYILDCLTPMYRNTLRNTYVLTKHLGENVIEDYSDRLPLVIYRPGIVISMWRDPLPGWIDNLNGPVGLSLAVGKGLLRTMHVNPELTVDHFPVDIVIKGLLAATWQRGIKATAAERLPVYNCSVQGNYDVSQMDAYNQSLEMLAEHPYNNSMWYPFAYLTLNKYLFYIQFMLLNTLPALFVDMVFRITGRKPVVMKMIRKAYIAMLCVSYYMQRSWDFRCERNWALLNTLKDSDREAFDFSVNEAVVQDYMRNARYGASKYLLKEKVDLESAKKLFERQKILHYTVKYLFYGAAFYFVLSSSYVQGFLSNLYTSS